MMHIGGDGPGSDEESGWLVLLAIIACIGALLLVLFQCTRYYYNMILGG